MTEEGTKTVRAYMTELITSNQDPMTGRAGNNINNVLGLYPTVHIGSFKQNVEPMNIIMSLNVMSEYSYILHQGTGCRNMQLKHLGGQ